MLIAHLPAELVRPGTRMAAVDASAPCVRFDDGTSEEADLVVGADGIRSVVRRSRSGTFEPVPPGCV